MYPWAQQNPVELAFLLSFTAGAGSILEIGCSHGMTLALLAKFANPKAKIVGVDFGEYDYRQTGVEELSAPWLLAVCRGLQACGQDAAVYFGDSQEAEAVEFVTQRGPYDVVFIDADHSYEGVKKDWENYGPLGTVVAFHDIAHDDCGVTRLWSEIKATGVETYEIINTPGWFGVGIVRMK